MERMRILLILVRVSTLDILDILDIPPFSNLELHKYFNLPLITKPDEFKNITKINISSKKSFLYYKIGIKAKTEIQKRIKKKLKIN